MQSDVVSSETAGICIFRSGVPHQEIMGNELLPSSHQAAAVRAVGPLVHRRFDSSTCKFTQATGEKPPTERQLEATTNKTPTTLSLELDNSTVAFAINTIEKRQKTCFAWPMSATSMLIPMASRLLFRGVLLWMLLVLASVNADDYRRVIVSFDTSRDCTESMFPPLWTNIVEQGLARVGIHYERWTHGYDVDGDGRKLQVNSGCPEWCKYLTQYCECLCVTTCEEQGNGNSNGNNGNSNGNGNRRHLRGDERQEELLKRGQAQAQYDALTNERRIEAAQFVVDEDTVREYIELQLDENDLTIECMQEQHRARVYLIR
ncbi:expressed unknown protein [Seminavis robusta]|uniref:Uncharacterized protein n=1 Tax=Seminavis robusta TaxID=568900 RepID=A0A9N8EK32_9STRA|nr:expressed unknown protein [Seminavis robusta]|eukprot:Sro1113_g242720.1 n/a (318) ;mRNA; f:32140-33093